MTMSKISYATHNGPAFILCQRSIRLITLLGLFTVTELSAQDVLQDRYIGCFYDNENTTTSFESVFQDRAMTVESCLSKCLNHCTVPTYAAIMNGNLCLCRNEYGTQVPDGICNVTCSGSQSEYCGGFVNQQSAYVLYTVCPIGNYGLQCEDVCHCRQDVPCDRVTGKCPDECSGNWTGTSCNTTSVAEQYIGCYRDSVSNRALAHCARCYNYTVRMTTEFCLALCSAANYTYFGTQYTYECYCGEVYDQYGALQETVCDYSCYGNPNETCGGPSANSVYSVCPVGYYGNGCSMRCNCLNDSICVYSNGSCPSSLCKPGWTGDSCNIRDCKQDNGDCSGNETCTIIDLKYSIISRCRCSTGFTRNFTWEQCTLASDPCKAFVSPCSPTTEICVSNANNYKCLKTGSTSESPTVDYPVGAVIGAAIGSAVAAAVITVLIFGGIILGRRQKEQLQTKSTAGNPCVANNTTLDSSPVDYYSALETENCPDENYTALEMSTIDRR